jgi:tetratricopeptide (TPR) repeat protein
MKASGSTLLVALVLLAVSVRPCLADEPTMKEKKQVADVAARLLKKMQPVKGENLLWPPDVKAISDEESKKNRWPEDMAFATWVSESGKQRPTVRITGRYLKRMQGDIDVLALTLAHELGHIYHKHAFKSAEGKPELVEKVFSQKHELEADAFGAQLMKDAGFSLIHAVRKKASLMRGSALHNAPLTSLTSTHPSWNDRFARVMQNEKVWDALATFDNGVVLLTAEQFLAAERCFKQVADFDPKCHEAWLNLGYARLMQYCDKLSAEDLKDLGIGQVVCGAFYRRAKSLEPPVRGKDARLWRAAEAALRTALTLKNDSALVRFNLGLAYLVHPEGKDSERASEFLGDAVKDIAGDRSLGTEDRIAFHINLGVALMDGSTRKDGLKQLAQARTLLDKVKGKTSDETPVGLALRYNEALVLADKKEAAKRFESYLTDGDPLSAWWSLAYDQYVKLCQDLKQKPRTRKALEDRNNRRFRMLMSLNLDGGKTSVALAERTSDVLPRLGKHKTINVEGETLKRYRFEKYGIEILAGERVIAILLASKKAPPVTVRPASLGAGQGVEVRVGMTRKELHARIPATAYRYQPMQNLHETGEDEVHHYFPWLGLGVQFDNDSEDGKITELVIVQVPAR